MVRPKRYGNAMIEYTTRAKDVLDIAQYPSFAQSCRVVEDDRPIDFVHVEMNGKRVFDISRNKRSRLETPNSFSVFVIRHPCRNLDTKLVGRESGHSLNAINRQEFP